MVFENVDTSVGKKQGNVGVARAVYEYTKLGYTVLAPLSDSDKYDIVIDDGQSLKRVQVKTSRFKTKNYQRPDGVRTGYSVQISTSGGNTKKNIRRLRQDNDYDLLFVLVDDGRCWSIPNSELTAKSQICVGASGAGAKYTEYQLK